MTVFDRVVERIESNVLDPCKLSSVMVIVPSIRFKNLLISTLAQKYQSLACPKILTLDQLIQEELRYSRSEESSDIEILFAIAVFLEQRNYRYLKISDLDLIFEFFNLYELSQKDLSLFSQLKKLVQDSCFQSQLGINHLESKIDELESLYLDIQKLGFLSSSKKRINQIDEFTNKLSKGLDQNYSFIYILGSNCYPPEYTKVIKALSCLSSTTCINEPDLFLLSDSTPVSDQDHSYSTTGSYLQSSFPLIEGFKFNSIIQEVSFVTDQIEYLLDSKISASNIGVVLLDEKTYTPLLTHLFESRSIRYNFTSAMSVKNSSFVSWLDLIFKLPLDSSLTYEFLSHPLSLSILSYLNQDIIEDTPVLEAQDFFSSKDFVFIKKILQFIINRQATTNQDHFNFNDILKDKTHSLHKICLNLFSKIQSLYFNKLTLDQSARVLSEFYEFINPISSEIYRTDNYNLKAIMGFNSFIEALLALSSHIKEPFTFNFKQILKFFESYINKTLYWTSGSSLKGVQVLKITEALLYPFSKLYVLAADRQSDQGFKDSILPSFILDKLGLDRSSYLKQRQAHLYSSLLQNTPSLTLSYIDSKDEENRSRFVEFLDLKHLITWHDYKSYKCFGTPLLSNESSTPSSKNELSLSSNFNLNVTNLFSTLSATSCQYLLDCPYKFLIKSNLIDYDLPDGSGNVRQLGSDLHRVVDRFIQKLASGSGFDRSSFLNELTKNVSSISKDLYHELTQYSWPKFLNHIDTLESCGINFKDSRSEYPISSYIDLHKDLSTKLSGRIDRLDRLKYSHDLTPSCIYILTDYKLSSNSIPSSKSLTLGKSCQLVLYANLLDQPCICGYWNLRKAQWSTSLVSESVKQLLIPKKSGSKSSSSKLVRLSNCSLDLEFLRTFFSITPSVPTIEQVQSTLKEHLGQIIDKILKTKEFEKNPSSCSKCYYKNICNLV